MGRRPSHSILQVRHCERELPAALAELSTELHEEALPPLHACSTSPKLQAGIGDQRKEQGRVGGREMIETYDTPNEAEVYEYSMAGRTAR